MFSRSTGLAQAATFNIPDGDVAGLIVAINTANANGEADTINLASGGTYTLTAVNNTAYGPSGLPVITSSVTVNGNGATIERSTAIGTPNFRILYVGYTPTSGDLTLDLVTIRGGQTFYYGGAIMNHGTLTVTESIITGNYSYDGGGGIYTSVTAAISNSVISDNISTYYGSGIFNEWGTLMLTDSTVSGNSSGAYRTGGIVNVVGHVTLINTTVSGNTAGAEGAGGIFSWLSGATLTLINSTVSGNTGSYYAGGIRNSSGATLTVVNSTVSGNQDINNGPGGITSDTINPSLKNTIVANNSPSDCGGVMTTMGHNIAGDASCGLAGTGDLNSTDPMLGPLADNGGPTHTHALLPGSPAIDAVPIADCTDSYGNTITMDQRGVSRPHGTACDIGSYEAEYEIAVTIDIKPGSFPNSINPKSKGVIPVAILTTETFDAATVDSTTVLFGPSGTEAAPVKSALQDVDGDGDIDMILHFNTQTTGIQCGEISATLTGETLDGQMIKGSDDINTVGCK